MSVLSRGMLLLLILGLLWKGLIIAFHLPPYILPSPEQVLLAGYHYRLVLLQESLPTFLETFYGLSLGILFGCITALMMSLFKPLHLWLLPILLISQSIPTFAIAPLVVLWLGYGISSKILITILMLFFPITTAFYDGLKRTQPGWLDLAKTMRASLLRTYLYIRIPAALPALASGIRVATAIAPMGAIIGEWVGASKGLGFLMLNANARMQIDLMFAALFAIIVFSFGLYFCIDKLLRAATPWQREQ